MLPFLRRLRCTTSKSSLERDTLLAQNRALHRIADSALALAGTAADVGRALEQHLAKSSQGPQA